MTIDEAISHAMEVAERQEYLSTQNHGYFEEKWNVKAREQCAECAADHRQLAEWLRELKEVKRLLKAAVKDLDDIYSKLGDNCEPMPDCKECPYIPSNQGCYCKWRYADEVLKLIGESNEP